ncbi:MAG: FG-GAP-like repeat-containing protein [Acidobacteriota bacterium]
MSPVRTFFVVSLMLVAPGLIAQEGQRSIEAGASAQDGVTTQQTVVVKDEKPPPPAGVFRAAGDLDVVVPGRLYDHVLARDGGKRYVVMLIGEPPAQADESGEKDGKKTRRVVAVDLAGDALITLHDELPEHTRMLYRRDVDGDGNDELFALRRGALDALGTVTTPARRLTLDLPGADPRGEPRTGLGTTAPEGAPLIVGASGRLWLIEPVDGRLQVTGEHALPTEARRRRGGIELTSPKLTTIWRADGSPLIAAGPISDGRQRLKTVLIDPSAPEDERRSEIFSLLPGAERVEESWYGLFAGRPRLLVTTTDAERIGIFDDKTVRLFPLLGDRTRAGRSPSLKAQTEVKRWNDLRPAIADVNRDGKDDLLLMQQADLSGNDLLVEAYLGKGTGRYEPRTRKSELDDADHVRLVGDLDGDGHGDLLEHRSGALVLHRGVDHRRRVVDKKPGWTRRLDDLARGTGSPYYTYFTIIDLDRRALLMTRRNDRGHGRVRIVTMDGP